MNTAVLLGSWSLAIGSCQVAAHDRISTKVTWTGEISPLLERRCLSCHVDGGFAAFSLATYEQARPWAVAIKEMVLAGEMPPWGAAAGVGHFANDRRPTRHEQELIAAWVDGGAPYALEEPRPGPPRVARVGSAREAAAGGLVVPLAPAEIVEETTRTAAVTLQLPDGMQLIAWSFEPGAAPLVESVELQLGSRWLGAWTPGDGRVEFPADAAVPLTSASTFSARIAYRAGKEDVRDFSRLRLWTTRDARPKTVREATVIRNWRAVAAVEVFALRPAADRDVEVVARFASGRAEPLGALSAPSRAPHPTYRLAKPIALPAGARIETTAPVRLLYTTGATRTVNSNVRRRPRR